MGVVEKAAGVIPNLADVRAAAGQPEQTGPRPFDLHYQNLADLGLYHPEAHSTQLGQELRAVKRRLLRRIGFLRASGDRQAFRMPGRQRNMILVTSTRASEGKTFSAINLALSLAIEDQIEVLLIDADIARPKVRTRFDLPGGQGLTDKLVSPAIDTGSLQFQASDAPLTIFPEGSRVNRAADLFAGEGCQRLLTQLSSEKPERLVIIDAPPVLATTEAVVLAKYADEVVFVVEANATPEPAVASAIDELLDVNPNISLMLNRCIIGSGGSHYGSYEYYGPEVTAERRTKQATKAEGTSHGAE